jgi:glutamate dehydrogenase
MADVRAATGDFAPMRARLKAAEAEVEGGENAEFLRWLAEDNFVLLGHRRFAFAEDTLAIAGGGQARPAARRLPAGASTR